jgi:hypothetical protein
VNKKRMKKANKVRGIHREVLVVKRRKGQEVLNGEDEEEKPRWCNSAQELQSTSEKALEC